MNRKINISIKYILLFSVVFLVLLIAVFTQNNKIPPPKKTTNTVKSIQVVAKKDSASINLSNKIPAKKIAYLVDSISKVYRKKPQKNARPKPTEKEVIASVYKDTISLKNGEAAFKIVSLGKILDLDFSFLSQDKIITNTTKTTITKYVVPNAWFINLEPKFTHLNMVGIGVSLDYTIKNKIRLGAGLEYNTLPITNKFMASLKIGIKL